MTITLELPDELAERFQRLPEAQRHTFALAALRHELEEVVEKPRYVRPEPPGWLATIQPRNPANDGTNGLHRIVGALEISESDAELVQLLQEES